MTEEQQKQKQEAATAALDFIDRGCCLGVGTGSTVNALIAQLSTVKSKIDRVVSSSKQSTRLLELAGFRCSTLESVGTIDIYIDGADEVNDFRQMIKGGGGAHTQEKILTVSSKKFIAMVDESKVVKCLGKFPLPVEVISLARGYVGRQLAAMGGNVAWREGFVTDNHNWILDTRLLDLTDAVATENSINAIVGVVENGLFAKRPADIVIIAGKDGIKINK